ncbi:MAG: hypothetical protein OXF72_07170 [Gammaproteobacteria bacterium]|nr:hypothetical protein [Gammaproteobacteria bacterium]MCY4278826.1 hypothetical protein [Gammaproteobacteria bacterium]
MNISTFTSREINQHIARAKKFSKLGPVFITTRGKPTHVLLCIEDYRRLGGVHCTFLESLSMPGLADIAFEPPKAKFQSSVPDLS